MTKIETIPILLLIDDYIYHLLNLCQYTRRKWLLNALAWGVEGVSPLFFFAKVVLCLTHGLLTRNGCKKSFFEDPPNHTDNEVTDFEEFLHLLARYR